MTTATPDHRHLFAADAKFAAVPAAGGRPATLKGYAMVWGVPSSDRGGYRVRLARGSATFDRLTHALFHHEHIGGPLGDTESDTLRILPADAYGQPVEIDVPDTTLGRDVFELVRTRRVRGMSFGVDPLPYDVSRDRAGRVVVTPTAGRATVTNEGGQTIVDVQAFDCYEVTVTGLPAFRESTIGVKPPVASDPGLVTLPVPPVVTYAEARQRNRFGLMKLESLRLPGAELPGRTA